MTLQEFINKNKSKYKNRQDPYHDAADDFADYQVKVLNNSLEKQKE